MNEKIEVFGARVHNLKNIDITIPRNSLTVFRLCTLAPKTSIFSFMGLLGVKCWVMGVECWVLMNCWVFVDG